MTRIEELSECLVKKHGVSKQQAAQFATDFFALIRERLEAEKLVKIKGLGTFKLSEMSARESVDVNTGERITIDGRLKITFSPENAVKERINSPFSSFESVDIEGETDFGEIDERYNGLTPAPSPKGDGSDMAKEVEAPANPEIPEIPETPAVPEIPAEQQPIEDIVRQIYQEEKRNEEIKDSHRMIKRMGWMLGILLVAVLVVLAMVCYKLFEKDFSKLEMAVAPKVQVVEKAHVVKKADVVEKTEKVSPPAPEGVAEPSKPTTTASATPPKAVEFGTKDPRVRTGAYVILGVDKTVTCQKSQSVVTFSKFYLGDGMECYVEAVNQGKKEFKAGEKVNLPKLETKKHWRRTHNGNG